jgi:hypothetical protein
MVSALQRGDRAYLGRLGLSSKQIDALVNRTAQFEMTFGTAAELAVEQAVRAGPPAPPAGVASAATQEIAQIGKSSAFRTLGRFLAREAPGLVLQAVLMVLFPPGVHIHNDNVKELSGAKLDPAVQDALKILAPAAEKLLDRDPSQSIYANVTARLGYRAGASSSGDLELYLEDITFVDMKITNANVVASDPKFHQTNSLRVAKQVTYSLLLYESESAAAARVHQESEKEIRQSEEDLRRPGMGAGSRAPGQGD